MNLTLGSSWPMYCSLSSKRKRFPLTTLTGSVQVAAIALIVAYLGLRALQSSSPALLGAMLPAVAALAVVATAAAPRAPPRGGAPAPPPPRRTRQAQLADDREAHRGYQQQPPSPSSCGRR